MHCGRNSHEVLKTQREEWIKTSTPTPSWFLPFKNLLLVLHVSLCWIKARQKLKLTGCVASGDGAVLQSQMCHE